MSCETVIVSESPTQITVRLAPVEVSVVVESMSVTVTDAAATSITASAEVVEVVVSDLRVLNNDKQRRVHEVRSMVKVPSQGTMYMGTPPTSAAPLVVSHAGKLDTITLSVDAVDANAWALQVLDATTLSVIATLAMPSGNTSASSTGLDVAVTQNQQLAVRLSGEDASAFANARATIEITQP